jgi:hypothetical protein
LVRSLFQQALMGADIQPALTAALQSNDPTAEALVADSWWDAQMRVLLDRDYDVIETMGVTREWLSALARFDLPLATESGEVSLNLRSLRMHRDDPQVREWVEARYNILRLRMVRANPAYFNAARSLGVLFETLLNDAPAHQYLHALTIYLSDWEDAKDLQSLVEEKINRK